LGGIITKDRKCTCNITRWGLG